MEYKVFINPGHDINCDPGACNFNKNINEANIVRNIGFMVQDYLEKAGVSTQLMQDNDLEYVCRKAELFQANLFLSIHTNSAENRSARGAECLVYGFGGQAEVAARCIQKQLVSSIDKLWDRPLLERKDLYVLWATSMPATIVECAFISNNEVDSELLINKQKDFAAAIARGVTDYFSGKR